eukprot:SAG31_NODE_2284_length_6014_cov_7.114962_2_plen_153_part_00
MRCERLISVIAGMIASLHLVYILYTYCLVVRSKSSSCVCCQTHFVGFCRLGRPPRPFRIRKGLNLLPSQASIGSAKRGSCAYTAVEFSPARPRGLGFLGYSLSDIIGRGLSLVFQWAIERNQERQQERIGMTTEVERPTDHQYRTRMNLLES